MMWLVGIAIQLVKLLFQNPPAFLAIFLLIMGVNYSMFGYIDPTSAIGAAGLFIWCIVDGIKKQRIKTNKVKREHNAKNPKAVNQLECDRRSAHGLIFGLKNNKVIAKPEEMDGHVLVVGGAGSGKSTCIAIPTLRAWQSSVFAIDIKGELYQKSAEYRSNIKVFNPLDENSYGYNPYIFLVHSKNPAQEARAIAQALIPLPPDTKTPFWIESAQTILTGAILHYYKDFSFVDTLNEILSHNPRDLIKIVSDSDSEKARLCTKSFVGIGDETLTGIFAELNRAIVTLVTDEDIISALSREKVISPQDLEYKQDIYINIPEHLLRQWKNLLTLIVNQFLTFFEKREEYNATPILFLLDEFARLGKIEGITDAVGTLRSKKITICIVLQSLAQLDLIYGKTAREVICDNCNFKAILNASAAETQETFSKLVGTYEHSKIAESQNFGLLHTKTSEGISETLEDKAIFKPSELATLKEIILLTSIVPSGFLRVDRYPYYNSIDESLENETKGKRILHYLCIPISLCNVFMIGVPLVISYNAQGIASNLWNYAGYGWFGIGFPILLKTVLIPLAKKAHDLAPYHKECQVYYPRLLDLWKKMRIVLIVALVLVGIGAIALVYQYFAIGA